MNLFDSHFRRNKLHYLLQCLLASAAMFTVLAAMRSTSNTAVMASLGASAFIAFTMPQRHVSRARFLIGGYVVGTAAGTAAWWLTRFVPLPEQFVFIADFPHVVFGAAAVGLAIFVMVVTNTEHPPAAGLALGFAILEQWSWLTPAVVLGGIAGLCGVKLLLRPVLRDLL
ncbi:MAG: HPP family protein [Planctomycetota bacterium]